MSERNMLIDALIKQTLYEMFERNIELTTEQHDRVARLLDVYTVKMLWGALPTGITGGTIVICDQPKDQEVISRSAAVQCENLSCNKYFCKRHGLRNCPHCGDRVS